MKLIKKFSTNDFDFTTQFADLLNWEPLADASVQQKVAEILQTVRNLGDAALLEYTARFDHWTPVNPTDLIIPRSQLELSWQKISIEQRVNLEHAAERIRAYAEHQKLTSWEYREPDGTLLGQKVTPLDRVGIYVPGGKAAYPSSVLMNAIPAQVAAVPEIFMAVPAPQGFISELVLAAAWIAGVARIFKLGGAQAIAAFAYGTATVPAVDKIVGPGNSYVALAKRAVFGQVGIDLIAGPSEILIICDGLTNPDWIVMDLFSQAEHDEDARAILLSWDGAFLAQIAERITQLLPTQPRHEIIAQSLSNHGALIQTRDLTETIELANKIAPEHLELSLEHPEQIIGQIHHAGAIFLGRYTAEALGDYCAGPNHVLPTARTARFSSPLGVYDFQKRTSLLQASQAGALRLGRTAVGLAQGEGLTAHARAAECRMI